MSKFFLLNTVNANGGRYYAGRTVDDTVDPKTQIEAAGGVLWDVTDTNVIAAAALATKLRERSADEATLNFIMMSAALKGGDSVTSEDLASMATGKGASLIGVEDALGFYAGTNVEAVLAEIHKIRAGRRVRGVVFANVASLSAFTVAGNDGLTYVAGERVLLANQTTASQNGIYVVGTVATGTAPLTRASDMATGDSILRGSTIEVYDGTIFGGSTWKILATAAGVVGTDDPVLYPRVCKGRLTLAAGTKTLGATKSVFTTQLVDPGGTKTGTIGFRVASAGRTAGKSGTAAAIVIAHVEAGTIQNLDTSTVDWSVTNW